MRTRPTIARACQTFVAAKTARPIVHPGGLVHDALVQLSLDPEVLSLSILGEEGPAPAELDRDVIIVGRRDGRYWLDVVETRPTRSLLDQDRFEAAMRTRGLRPLTMAGRDVMGEPRFSSARAVWSHRGFKVSIEMRLALMHALADVTDMRLEELCAAVPGPLSPVLSTMSLACSDAVELNIKTHALGPDTRVRWRH